MFVQCHSGWRAFKCALLANIMIVSNDEGDAVYTPIRFVRT